MVSLTPMELEALQLSLRVAFFAVTVSLPLGIAVAWILARYSFPGKPILDGIIHLPLVLPPVVVGYLLLILLGREGFLGQWLYRLFDITLAFTWQGAAVAAAVMAFPLMVRSIRLALELVDRNLEAAAFTLGAGYWNVFFTVTLPLIAPGILAGSLLAFARSLGEFGATITFAANIPGITQTIPLALYSVIQTPEGELAALRLAILSVALSFAALAISEILARRLRTRMVG
ncbi:molybdate ABC transporter permease subunit [Denitrobaculum tricleocarpae]|uniref:Molybdenum transport system permease n=1 Tax=Denitrobaculum tricleocarpae TaxID=2591009 RepID=A0A545TQ55_9PROT|nr:molybdate ABC transporter permease subunit [Denitrobaculum tricleocarpae]TQV79354.1 molybdate ABC transporter permease subunit [Denitrobaculum tricleocarpae]